MSYTKKSKQRKFLPTLGELIDRLSIHQLKEVFIPENKKNYAKEMSDMVHDIDMILKEHNGEITGSVIRSIVVLAQMNTHIWHNESQVRKGTKGSDNLMLTHGLNGIRNTAINKIMEVVGGRKDYKVDCIASDFKDWDVSW
ncbi:hypothetical protein HOE22_03895 [Candidatus Woesearchaeota archaeon]|jgi:hypothetical protein|nr:hypothetical protein [Candidatus Woesearchaeota archaeon]MBT7557521.1 hypothetical protein [Candidatus Woesearchaeota archaeon]